VHVIVNVIGIRSLQTYVSTVTTANMATIRGERFNIDLSDEEANQPAPPPALVADFVGDVQERAASVAVAPTFKSNVTGFPAHKKRTGASRFKKNRNGEDDSSSKPATLLQPAPSMEQTERQRIDDENRRKLAEMSETEIEQERQELFAGLSPALIERLLKRSTIDDEPPVRSFFPTADVPAESARRPSNAPRKVSFALPDIDVDEQKQKPTAEHHSISDPSPRLGAVDNIEPEELSSQKQSPEFDEAMEFGGTVHFPRPQTAPDLDPASSSFLDDLHEKYFPNLAHDPSKLAWMSAATKEEDKSYDPSQAGLDPSVVRFDFKGGLIPPSTANALSTDLGLHHHGDAPSAAGYTISELAHLARSSFPAQRCIAYQTLGRILFRLGIGEFGRESDMDLEGPEGERAKLAKGLWAAIKDNRVLDTLTEEANKERGHQTSIALAQEAVWNWQRGGGRELKAV
jgi:hypothetical protein